MRRLTAAGGLLSVLFATSPGVAQDSPSAQDGPDDAEIQRLRDELAQRADLDHEGEAQAENERLARQVALLREEYEAKIERLNSRVRELTGSAGRVTADAEPSRKGFFRC